MKQRITVLGSTGSIGSNTLDVLARHPERFEVFALSAATQVDLMLAQCAQFQPRYAVMASAAQAQLLADKIQAEGLKTEVLTAPDALETIAAHPDVDAVMAAIVGAAGLAPCLAAARAGKRLLLANKEALVVGGDVFMRAVREGGATLLPIDSEHSAIFQSLPEDPSTWERRVEKIILTASGGPFRSRAPVSLRDVTPEQACAHPNWVMGRKISVDSAT
ncbi:MAG: 1-deoxy-D-xylulose-5-phosphate reductoisomerase, partial [Burkholderiaceae bacterium]|nr:1-deoxy-D-xylulose-5-phosphate reductoisomerase [Burkholderiaceae bacterium]